MPERLTRADLLLAENLRTLIAARSVDAGDVAMATGHGSSWISKILNGDRGMRVEDVGKVASYFGLTVAELFSPGISAVTERRRVSRRSGSERRRIEDRRKNSVTHTSGFVVEHSRPALKGGPVPHVPVDPDPATLEVNALSLSDIDERIHVCVTTLGALTSLRERALTSLAGDGTNGASSRRARPGTTSADVARDRTSQRKRT